MEGGSNWHQGGATGLVVPREHSREDKKEERAYLMEGVNEFVN